MIDSQGYRANVGIVLINNTNQVLIAKRIDGKSWQLPQGGIDYEEGDVRALYRELKEEVGLNANDVRLIARTPKWLRYTLPKDKLNIKSSFVGQKQIWFLLRIKCADEKICLDKHTEIEFTTWDWVDYWQPITEVIYFKKNIYEDMLKAFAPVVFNNLHKIPKHLTRKLNCTAVII